MATIKVKRKTGDDTPGSSLDHGELGVTQNKLFYGNSAGNSVEVSVAGHGHTFANISGTATNAQIPNLDASKITSGTFVDARIPNLAVSKISDSTTVGQNLVKLTNPSAIRFIRINANNTVSALDASSFRSAIGAGTSSTTGTVTSVGLSAPTGFQVSNSPVTTSGTLTLSFSAGYSLPTTAKQGNWDTAFGWGNHASAGYLTSVPNNHVTNARLADMASQTIKGRVTANSGDPEDLTQAQVRTFLGLGSAAYVNTGTFAPASHNQAWSTITGTPTTTAGYGITDAITTANIGSQSVNYAASAGIAGGAILADKATVLETVRTINGTSFDGSRNITTTSWGTTRTITIGGTGKAVNGSAAVSWSLNEIGAAAASHNHGASDITSGTLTVSQGGTGATTFSSGEVLIGAGAGAITTLSRNGIDSRGTFPPSAHNLTSHADVSVSSPTNGQVLKYNGTNWVNANESGGGGGGPLVLTQTVTANQFWSSGDWNAIFVFDSLEAGTYQVMISGDISKTSSASYRWECSYYYSSTTSLFHSIRADFTNIATSVTGVTSVSRFISANTSPFVAGTTFVGTTETTTRSSMPFNVHGHFTFTGASRTVRFAFRTNSENNNVTLGAGSTMTLIKVA